ncbi:MAG: hypothetical protein E3J54_03445 [Actinobacteria bacterium]|nr:MAG: hypothetical protein E3J54_03445 [Actinomycetota bacterium]
MRQMSPYTGPEDTERIHKIINNLIKDFNFSVKQTDKYTAKNRQVFRIKRQYAPGSLKVFLNGRLQRRNKHYTVYNVKKWSSSKYVIFRKKYTNRRRITFKYRTRKTFTAVIYKPFVKDHIAWNYQTAETLYYVHKHRQRLGLTSKQINGIIRILKTLASYSSKYSFIRNQYGLAWNSGILRFTYETTHNRAYARMWKKSMAATLNDLLKKDPGRQPDIDADFTLNYHTNDKSPLSWDTQEYSNIVLRALDDIGYFKGSRMNRHRKFFLLLGLRQNNLGNFMLNGYPNWDTGYGLHRQFSSQYWTYSLYSLKTILATPQFNVMNKDNMYARYLIDQATNTYASSDTYHSDPKDGAIGRTIFNVKQPFIRYSDNNKLTANADFIGQISLMLNEYNLLATPPAKPENIWHWAYKQQKLAVSTPYYSTTIVGNNRGTKKFLKSKIGMPYGGPEMTTLMALNNTSYSMNRPASTASSFNFRVVDQKRKKALFNSYNALVSKKSNRNINKTRKMALQLSPSGNLSKLKPYRLKKKKINFDKLKLNSKISFDNNRFTFTNTHVFYNDGILLTEKIRTAKKRGKRIRAYKNPVKVSKNFPAGTTIDQVVVSTYKNDTLIYDKSSNLHRSFKTVKKMKYLHYRGQNSGLLLIPHTINWKKRSYIKVSKTNTKDMYNSKGIRPIYFVIQSKQRLKKLTFSVYIAFTNGSQADAEAKYRGYLKRFK